MTRPNSITKNTFFQNAATLNSSETKTFQGELMVTNQASMLVTLGRFKVRTNNKLCKLFSDLMLKQQILQK